MLDAQQLAHIVEQEIRNEARLQVQQAVSQPDWLQDLEQQIIGFVQDRITARFSNIGTLPDLVTTVEQKVGEMFANGFVPDLNSYVDQNKIRQTVDLAVEHFVENTINNLTLDPQWIAKIETLIAQRTEDRIRSALRDVDLGSKISQVVLENREQLADAIKRDFRTAGIIDQSASTQLTVMDGVVVVEHETVTHDLTVEHDVTIKGDVLIQGAVGIQGRINTDNETWQDLSRHVGNVTYDRIKKDFAKELMDTVIQSTKSGIDIENITVGGQSLISGDTLSAGVTRTAIKKIGILEDLEVSGISNLAKTLTVQKNRVGVNTQEPDSALSVWDEETNLALGKYSKNTSFVGSNRRQNLVIGVNRQNNIEIDSEGMVTIQRLRVGRNIMSWGTEVPGYSGTKGDIVFNTNANDGIFAWVCLGAFRWQTVRMSQ
jgi:hypothetical protein